MESEKNKDIARRFIQVWGRGNLEIIDKLASSELSVYYPAFPHALKGTAAFKERLEKLRVGFGDADIEIDEEIAEGDKVVLRWTYSATHQAEYPPGVPPTGKRMTWTGITIYRIVDGKIVEERGRKIISVFFVSSALFQNLKHNKYLGHPKRSNRLKTDCNLHLTFDDYPRPLQLLFTPRVIHLAVEFRIIDISQYISKITCYTFGRKQIFETERLIFRKIEKTDSDDLHKILRDPEVMKYISEIKTKEGTFEWISISQKSYQENGYGPCVVILKNSVKLIGYCGIYLQKDIDGKDEVELLYAFHKKHWNKGYATEAAKAALKYSRNTFKILRYIALVEYGNIRSAKVAKKAGMKLEKNIKKSGRSYNLYAIQFKH